MQILASERAGGAISSLAVALSLTFFAAPAVGAQTTNGLPGDWLARAAELHDLEEHGFRRLAEDAWLHAEGELLEVRQEDAAAPSPITIGPPMTLEDWGAEANQPGASFGCSVASAGDVNGDGFDDVIIGACRFNAGQDREGRAYVYHGSASGLAELPAWTAESNQAFALFGSAVACAGDVNGDGFDDVIVGAPGFDNPEFGEGRAYVFHGSATGLGAVEAWSAESNQANAAFGGAVASAGDVNGDGFDDVIVGAAAFDNGQAAEGRAYVYFGSAAGLSAAADWTAEPDRVGALFGSSVSTAGDVNGDGFDEVLVGAHFFSNGQNREGRAFVYHGSASGPSAAFDWRFESNQDFANLGNSVSNAGDVNADGFDDVIVGASAYTNGSTRREGRAYLIRGSPMGLRGAAAWIVEGNQMDANLGESVSGAGDVNGDGYDDVIVGAHQYTNGQRVEGRAYVYHGSPTGLSATEAWTAESNQFAAGFGRSVSRAGDVNGDGLGDLIVGAFDYDNPQVDEGRAFGYYGRLTEAASARVYLGFSSNPHCFRSNPPALGKDWNISIDTTVRPSASSSLLVIYSRDSAGTMLAGGELLVELSSSLLLSLQLPASGPTTELALAVPADASLLGMKGTAQVVVLGGGFTLCNAYGLVIGF